MILDLIGLPSVINNSITINFTKIGLNANKTGSVSWPIAFATKICSIANNKRCSSTDGTDNFGAYDPTNTGVSFANGHGTYIVYDLIAIGY